MKKFLKLMTLITVLTFCMATTVFAAETTYESSGSGDVMGGEGDEDDENAGLNGEGDEDDENAGLDGEGSEDDEDAGLDKESAAGGKASPQTSASVAPIVAMVGLAAAGATAALKRK